MFQGPHVGCRLKQCQFQNTHVVFLYTHIIASNSSAQLCHSHPLLPIIIIFPIQENKPLKYAIACKFLFIICIWKSNGKNLTPRENAFMNGMFFVYQKCSHSTLISLQSSIIIMGCPKTNLPFPIICRLLSILGPKEIKSKTMP